MMTHVKLKFLDSKSEYNESDNLTSIICARMLLLKEEYKGKTCEIT